MSTPATYDIKGYRGDTLTAEFAFTKEDGTPYPLPTDGWKAQVRYTEDSRIIAAEFTIDATQAAVGVLIATIDESVTAGLSTNMVWDLQNTHGGDVRTYLAGKAHFTKDVTR